MALINKAVPYSFDPQFEKQVATLACSRPRFWGRVGCELDPELFKGEAAKLAMRAARAIATEVGHGPGSPVLVIQRLRGWMNDGKCALEAIKKVSELFDDAEDAGLLDDDSVIAELAPMLQERMRKEAVKTAIESFGKKGDLSKAMEIENKAARIGQVDTSIGTILGPESFDEIIALRDLDRLPTGVVELDSQLDGGLQVGGLGVAIGGSGDGKSMFLSHVTGVNVWEGLFVGYASLELPRAMVLARIKANMRSRARRRSSPSAARPWGGSWCKTSRRT